MCGIFCYKGSCYDCTCLTLANNANNIKHRGPDQTKLLDIDDVSMVFHRLSIIDPTPEGMQPMELDDAVLMCNGEIFNYKELTKTFNFKTESQSDCEVLLHMYTTFGRGKYAIQQICNYIDAEFVFVIYDKKDKTLYVARDFGIRPLFYADTNDGLFFCSEAKGIVPFLKNGESVHPFPPRSFWDSQSKQFCQYFFLSGPIPKNNEETRLNTRLSKSVKDRLISDRPIGFFLSGGLDSSLIVSLARKELGNDVPMHTFSIGIREENETESKSPDIQSARIVSKFCNTIHHEVTFTFTEALSMIEEIIYHLETFDTTTIRASTPQYLLSKYINENTNIRVLLSGEGSDELMFGYLMWHMAPNKDEAQMASIELCENLYMYDCLRCDRATAAHGLEVRVPFLANHFIHCANMIDPDLKLPQEGLEKHLLRHSFKGELPDSVLFRTKAAFSDAVGNLWVDRMKEYTNSIISDKEFEKEVKHYAHCTPRTKEELFYRRIFEKHFPNQGHIIKDFWKIKWNDLDDPSARFLPCYKTS